MGWNTIWLGLVPVLLSGIAGGASAPQLIAKQLIAQHVEARGGASALAGMRSAELKGWGRFGNLNGNFDLKLERDGRARLDIRFIEPEPTTMTIGSLTVAFDGQGGWISMPGQVPRPMSARETAEFREAVDIQGPLLNLSSLGGTALSTVGTKTIGSIEAYEIIVKIPNRPKLSVFLDVRRRLEVMLRSERTIGGKQVEVETTLDAYEKHAGVQFPHLITSTAAGKVVSTVTIDTVGINNLIDASVFSAPDMR